MLLQLAYKVGKEMTHRITRKEDLNAMDYLIEVEAPMVAERFQPGNFAVLITVPQGERIPMSIQKVEDGKITMFIKRLGKTRPSSWTALRWATPSNRS